MLSVRTAVGVTDCSMIIPLRASHLILLYQFVKLISRYKVYDLSEDIFACIHNSAVLAAKLLIQIQIKKS